MADETYHKRRMSFTFHYMQKYEARYKAILCCGVEPNTEMISKLLHFKQKAKKKYPKSTGEKIYNLAEKN